MGSYQRAPRSMTTGRDRRETSSGGVMGPSTPLGGGGGRQGDPRVGSSRAWIPLRHAGFEGGSSS